MSRLTKLILSIACASFAVLAQTSTCDASDPQHGHYQRFADHDGAIAESYGVKAYPSYFLIDGTGTIIMEAEGSEFDRLFPVIEALLKE